jgi:hypothetical protein
MSGVRSGDVELTMVSMMGIGMRYVQVCLNDTRFTDVEIDVGKPVVQGRWKNFRKRRRLVRLVRSDDLGGWIGKLKTGV